MDIAQLGISVDSRQVKTATGDLSGIVKAASAAESATAKLSSAVAGLGAAFAGLNIAGAGLQAMRDFSREMAGLQAVTRASTADMEKLADQARLLGAATQYGAGEAASAQRALAQAGLQTNQILSATGNVLALAQAGQLGLAQSADLAANVMSQFNLTAQQTGMIADVLVKTGDKATTSVAELGEGFKYAGPLASSLGVSLTDTAAALGIISNSGIKASSAGTGLFGVFRQLSNVSNEAAAILQSYGVSLDQVDISTRGLIPVVELLASKNIAAGDAVKIFGSESVGAALALLKAGEGVRAFSADLQNATGAAQQNADIMANNLDAAIKGVGGAFEGLVLSIKGSDGALKDAANTATGVINSFSGVNAELVRGGQLSASAAAGYDTIANSLAILAAMVGGRVVGSFAAATAARVSDMAASRAATVATAQEAASVLALETRLKALAIQELATARIRGGDTVAASAAAAAATARYNAAVVASDAANKAASLSAGVLRGALALLGGPIGLITTALTVGVTAWMTWGNKGGDAIDKLNAKLREHNRLKGAMGSAELADLKEGYTAANEQLKVLLANRDRLMARGEHTGGIDAEIKQLRQTMVGAKERIAETTAQIKAQQVATSALAQETTKATATQNTFLTEQQQKLAEVAALKKQFAEEDAKGNFDAETRANRQIALQEKIDAIMKRGASTRASATTAAIRQAEQVEDAYGDLERSLRKQLLTEDELTTAQKVSMDLTDKRYKHLSDQQKANLIALAKEVDAFKAQEKLFKDMAASAQELADSDTKRQQAAADAAYQGRKAAEDQLAKLQEEADTYGMTEAEIQRYLLAKAEEKLALEKGGEARQGVIDQLEREIEARKKLTTVTGAAETKKATEALGGAVQGTIADAIKAGLNADNPIKGFAQSLGNSVKNALYDAVAKGLAARITGALGFGGVSGGAMAGGGGDMGFLTSLLGGVNLGSVAQSFSASSLGSMLGLSDAGALTQAGTSTVNAASGLSSMSGASMASYAALAYGLIDFSKGVKSALKSGDIADVWKGTQSAKIINGLFGGGGGQKFGGEGAIGRANAGLFPEGQTDAQVQAALQTFSTGLNDVAKKFGGTLNNLGFAYGYETDPKGTAGNFFSSVLEVNGQILRNVQVQKFSGEVSDQMAAEFKTATVLALKAANLSADLQTAFDGFDPAIEGAADKVMARLEEIKAVADAFDTLGKAMPQLSGLSLQARESLIQLAGGADALASSVSTYYDNFYSEAEKTTRATEQLSAQMSELGISMPASRDAFRALVESQDLTTESGQKTYAALISMSGAFASLVPAVDAVSESSRRAAEIASERSSLELRLLEAQGNATEVLRRTREAEIAAVDETNRALVIAIQAEQDRKAKLEQEQAIADERARLEIKLLEEQGNATEVLRRTREAEIAAVHETNRALVIAIQAEQDRKAAADAAAAAAQQAEAAARQEIERKEAAAKAEAAAWQAAAAATKAARQEAARQAAAAEAAAAQIKSERASIENRLLELRGDYASIQARARGEEMRSADSTNRDLLKQLYMEQDRLAAMDAAEEAVKSSLQMLRQSVDAEKAAIASALQVTISTLEDRAKAEKLTAETIFKAQTASIKSARETQKAVFEAAKDAAQGGISKLGDVLSLVAGKKVDTADDVATTLSRRQSALSSLSSIGAGVRAGEDAVKFQDQLASAMEVVSESGEQLYSSFADYQFDQRRANAEITSIEQGTASQLSIAEQTLQAMIEADKRAEELADAQLEKLSATYDLQRDGIEKQLEQDRLAATAQAERDAAALDFQIETAEGQYKSLMGIDDRVRSFREATLQVFNSLVGLALKQQVPAASVDGSHRNGLAEVPFDGYRAELHAGERVLTAQQADSSDKMAVDIAEMRREMASAMLAIADNTRRTARLQERWDGDGLPDARGY